MLKIYDGEGEAPQERRKPTRNRVGEFPCGDCDYVATRKEALQRHFKNLHLGVK